MDRIRGKRFDNEPKLNIRKIFVTIIALIVVVMVIISIRKLFKKNNKVSEMTVPIAYFTIYQNNKYGVIDSRGNVIVRPTYEEMIIIPNSSKAVFVTDNVDYQTGEHKTRVINESNKAILTSYSNLRPIENSNNNNIWYEDNVFIFEKDGLYGLIDFSGNVIADAEYTDIYALDSIPKSIVVEKNGIKGIVNSSLGKVVVECEYNDITTLNENSADDGYIVNKDGKYGIVSGTGKLILDCNYNQIEHAYGNNMYVVNDGNGLKIIDSLANVVIQEGFNTVKSINGENIIIEKDNLYGVININGEEKIPTQYEDLSFACDKYYIAKMNGLYGIVSLDNIVCVDFKYVSLSFLNTTNFYEGENSDFTTDILNRNFDVKLANVIISELNADKAYMRVRIKGEYKYYNFNFEEKTNRDVLKTNTIFLAKKGGKYGYVNKNGDLIVNYIYDDAHEQNAYGYACVKQNGKWGVLAQDGTVILKPSVNLDDSLYIDFINVWHLYKDNNLNVYAK